MTWLNLSLIALIISLLLVLAFSRQAQLWIRVRPIATLGFQLAGILVLTWILVSLSQRGAPPPSTVAAPPPAPDAGDIVRTALRAAERSLALIGLATAWGSFAGLGAAFLLQTRRSRQLLLVIPIATVLWVIPTFLLAVVVQEVQAQIYNVTGAAVSGGFSAVNPFQIFWASIVLGVRPAAYIFRQGRATLDLEATADHVRTARAKGLTRSRVVWRHIVRPAAATLLGAWMSSFRLMIGALPLVEFFFGYPGLGEMLILSLGLTFGIQGGPGQAAPDLAIALVVTMAAILVLLESGVSFLQALLDPRISDARAEAA
jgi:ABC-type dipeptide/oligopeptide/nickel transport system permease component